MKTNAMSSQVENFIEKNIILLEQDPQKFLKLANELIFSYVSELVQVLKDSDCFDIERIFKGFPLNLTEGDFIEDFRVMFEYKKSGVNIPFYNFLHSVSILDDSHFTNIHVSKWQEIVDKLIVYLHLPSYGSVALINIMFYTAQDSYLSTYVSYDFDENIYKGKHMYLMLDNVGVGFNSKLINEYIEDFVHELIEKARKIK